MMTPNKEDYLKLIYEIGESKEKISNKKIAEGMGVSAPSASEMIKKLLLEELILKDSLLGYKLTDSGQALVSELYRKHRLIEMFLMRELHYTIEEVHAEAEVLEHTVSTFFIDRLEENLGFPEFCPHGGSIPKKGELLKESYHQSLEEFDQPGSYCIKRIHDKIELLNYLDKNGLGIGKTVELIQIDSFAQTYTLAYQGKQLAIPMSIAKQIYLERI